MKKEKGTALGIVSYLLIVLLVIVFFAIMYLPWWVNCLLVVAILLIVYRAEILSLRSGLFARKSVAPSTAPIVAGSSFWDPVKKRWKKMWEKDKRLDFANFNVITVIGIALILVIAIICLNWHSFLRKFQPRDVDGPSTAAVVARQQQKAVVIDTTQYPTIPDETTYSVEDGHVYKYLVACNGDRETDSVFFENMDNIHEAPNVVPATLCRYDDHHIWKVIQVHRSNHIQLLRDNHDE